MFFFGLYLFKRCGLTDCCAQSEFHMNILKKICLPIFVHKESETKDRTPMYFSEVCVQR